MRYVSEEREAPSFPSVGTALMRIEKQSLDAREVAQYAHDFEMIVSPRELKMNNSLIDMLRRSN